MAIIASAASAALPPLLRSLDPRPHPGLIVVLDGEDAVAERQRLVDRKIHDRPGGFTCDDVVVGRLPADDAAQHHEAVIVLEAAFARLERHGERRGHLQHAGHRNPFIARPGARQRLDRPLHQLVGEIFIEACVDDQKMRHGAAPFGQISKPREQSRALGLVQWNWRLISRRRSAAAPDLCVRLRHRHWLRRAGRHSARSGRPRD